jgi:hypothetical protein
MMMIGAQAQAAAITDGGDPKQAAQISAGLAAQQAIAHANMVMASNPNNYHIMPLEDKNPKKYSSL